MATPNKTRGEYRPIYEALFDGVDYRRLDAAAKLCLLTIKGKSGAMGLRVWPALAETLAYMTGHTVPVTKKAVKQLIAEHWIQYEDGVVWLVRGMEFEPQLSTGMKHRAWLVKQLEGFPRSAIVARFCEHYAAFFDTVPPDGDNGQRERRAPAKPDSLSDGPSHTPSDSLSHGLADTTTPSPSPSLSPSLNQGDQPTTNDGPVVVRAKVAAHRTALVVRANEGIAQLFGEQPVPLRWDSPYTFTFAEALEAAGVPLDFAEVQLFAAAARTRPADGRPPSAITYFTAAVLNAWKIESAKRVIESASTAVESGTSEPTRDPNYFSAMRFAREGDLESQQYCRERGWVWEKAS